MPSAALHLPYDFHVHTYYSPCARRLDEQGVPLAAPERHLFRAAELGLKAIAFTDHFVQDPAAPGVVLYYKGTGPAMLDNLRGELARMDPGPVVQTLVGCETETMQGNRIGVDPGFSRTVDMVLVPTTHYHLPDVPQPSSWDPAAVARHMLDRFEAVVQLDYVDSIAHPFADHEEIIGDLRAIYEAMPWARLQDALGAAARHSTALEVNGAALTSAKLPHYREVYAEICSMAKPLGLRFTYGSDAHDYRRLGMNPEVALWLSETGLTADDFLTPEELLAKRL